MNQIQKSERVFLNCSIGESNISLVKNHGSLITIEIKNQPNIVSILTISELRNTIFKHLFEREVKTTIDDISDLLILGTCSYATYVITLEYIKHLRQFYVDFRKPSPRCFNQECFKIYDPKDGIMKLLLKCDDTGNYLETLLLKLANALLNCSDHDKRNCLLQLIKNLVKSTYAGNAIISEILNKVGFLIILNQLQFENSLAIINELLGPNFLKETDTKTIVDICNNTNALLKTQVTIFLVASQNENELKPILNMIKWALNLISKLIKEDFLKATHTNLIETIFNHVLLIADNKHLLNDAWQIMHLLIIEKDLLKRVNPETYVETLQLKLCNSILISGWNEKTCQFEIIEHLAKSTYPGKVIISQIINKISTFSIILNQFDVSIAMDKLIDTNLSIDTDSKVIEAIFMNAENLLSTYVPFLLELTDKDKFNPILNSIKWALNIISKLVKEGFLKEINTHLMESIVYNALLVCDNENLTDDAWSLVSNLIAIDLFKTTDNQLIESIFAEAKNRLHQANILIALSSIYVISILMEKNFLKRENVIDIETCNVIFDKLNLSLRSADKEEIDIKWLSHKISYIIRFLANAGLLKEKNDTTIDTLKNICIAATELLKVEKTIDEGELIISSINEVDLLQDLPKEVITRILEAIKELLKMESQTKVDKGTLIFINLASKSIISIEDLRDFEEDMALASAIFEISRQDQKDLLKSIDITEIIKSIYLNANLLLFHKNKFVVLTTLNAIGQFAEKALLNNLEKEIDCLEETKAIKHLLDIGCKENEWFPNEQLNERYLPNLIDNLIPLIKKKSLKKTSEYREDIMGLLKQASNALLNERHKGIIFFATLIIEKFIQANFLELEEQKYLEESSELEEIKAINHLLEMVCKDKDLYWWESEEAQEILSKVLSRIIFIIKTKPLKLPEYREGIKYLLDYANVLLAHELKEVIFFATLLIEQFIQANVLGLEEQKYLEERSELEEIKAINHLLEIACKGEDSYWWGSEEAQEKILPKVVSRIIFIIKTKSLKQAEYREKIKELIEHCSQLLQHTNTIVVFFAQLIIMEFTKAGLTK